MTFGQNMMAWLRPRKTSHYLGWGLGALAIALILGWWQTVGVNSPLGQLGWQGWATIGLTALAFA